MIEMEYMFCLLLIYQGFDWMTQIYRKYSFFFDRVTQNVLKMLYMFSIHHEWFTLNTKEVFNSWNSNSTIIWLFVLFSPLFTPWNTRFSIPTPPDADDLVIYIILPPFYSRLCFKRFLLFQNRWCFDILILFLILLKTV